MDVLSAGFYQSSRDISDALDRHADALIQSSKASEKYARNLVIATWALVMVTFFLVVGTVISTAILLRNCP